MAQTATGGGVSALFSLPTYQMGVAGESSTTYRNVPDVAMPAVGVDTYEAGSWGQQLGTSWSAPEVAAMIAELNQYCQANLGNANVYFYQAFGIANGDYVAITSGNNQYGSTTPYYSAAAGYNNATGLGLPLATAIEGSVCQNRTLASWRRMTVNTESVGRGAQSFAADLRPAAVRRMQDLGTHPAFGLVKVQAVLLPSQAGPGAEAQVSGVLRAAGFSITRTFGNHLIVDAQGPAGAVQSLFGTTLHDYAQPGHGTRYAPSSQVVVPASLAPYVSGVVLDNVITAAHRPTRTFAAQLRRWR
jgi:subtilase family serine protease